MKIENILEPDIAIILPVFNGGKTIKETLNSLLNQTYKKFIIYICDDGSKDHTIDIIKQYNSKKIKIFENKRNRGLGFTLNKLIALLDESIEFIAMAEQDDFYYAHRLEKQVEYLRNNIGVGLVSGIADHWNGFEITTQFPGLLVRGESYPSGIEFFKLNYREQIKVVNSCIMFRYEVHIKNKMKFSEIYPSISVDWDYILRFSLKSQIHGLNLSLVRLERSSKRKSLTTKNKLKYDTANKLITNFYKEFPTKLNYNDYQYARATQKYLELGNEKYLNRIKKSFLILFIDPSRARSTKMFLKTIIKPFFYIINSKKIS